MTDPKPLSAEEEAELRALPDGSLTREEVNDLLDRVAARAATPAAPSYPSPGESAGFDRLVDDLRAEFDQGHFIPWDEVIARIALATPAAPEALREALDRTENTPDPIDGPEQFWYVTGWRERGDALRAALAADGVYLVTAETLAGAWADVMDGRRIANSEGCHRPVAVCRIGRDTTTAEDWAAILAALSDTAKDA